MTRLIDADEVLKTICATTLVKWQKAIIWALVDIQKTVDAVPVIRCKDCKWNSSNNNWVDCMISEMYGRNASDNYCSRAERRKDDRRQDNTV
jgi:hypothetical protein